MLGRFVSLIIAGALGALAVLIYDPTLFGPEAPAIGFGELEVFRPAILLAVGLLALAAFCATVQPRPRKKPARVAMPLALQEEAPVEAFVAEPFAAEPVVSEPVASEPFVEAPFAAAEPEAEPTAERRSPFEASVPPLSFGGGARPTPVW